MTRPTGQSGLGGGLRFVPQPMVHWFDPGELLRTSVKLMLSSIFGQYADKREMQGVLEAEAPDYSDDRGLWLDFLADSGDGFNSTYTVARAVAEARLEVEVASGHMTLPRGRVLVMGGDEVYPTATLENYQNKLVGPFGLALPDTASGDHPDLFAIPGNHDWYDGLTTFMRLFCQQGWIGGWRTRQRRSYFGLRLPHGWWLWGIDIGFDAYIDEPQKKYFAETVGQHVTPGDRVIVCSAKPGWVQASRDGPEAYRNVDYVERKIIRPLGARLAMLLSGDTHHYAHYADSDGTRHYLTAGGGGAYLSPTHHLPANIGPDLQLHPQSAPINARLDTTFPSAQVSRRKLLKVIVAPLRNPRFVALLGLVPLIVGWTLQSGPQFRGAGSQVLANAPASELVRAFLSNGAGLLLLIGLFAALSSFANRDPRVGGSTHWILGGIHALTHIGIALTLVHFAARVFATHGRPVVGPTASVSLALWVVGGAASAVVMGLYLFVANIAFGIHDNEAFSIQADENWKNFLRFHFDSDGGVTVYPVGIERVCTSWTSRLPDGTRSVRPEPATPIVCRLIEDPIRVLPVNVRQSP